MDHEPAVGWDLAGGHDSILVAVAEVVGTPLAVDDLDSMGRVAAVGLAVVVAPGTDKQAWPSRLCCSGSLALAEVEHPSIFETARAQVQDSSIGCDVDYHLVVVEEDAMYEAVEVGSNSSASQMVYHRAVLWTEEARLAVLAKAFSGPAV